MDHLAMVSLFDNAESNFGANTKEIRIYLETDDKMLG